MIFERVFKELQEHYKVIKEQNETIINEFGMLNSNLKLIIKEMNKKKAK